ncbi:hypothetical protein HUT19_07090 [Streptomyces sp. NA02950]|uniref:hypothetical protein n=1 Tax=Streptomyces sp. NA02950 TaxID=2742137 RepID=UPI001591831C|nr:hypothetical protein [Streptomyces sp. NA02950]QKV91542.1 hypothetical protein HUT19_07090 [Streptomyces sp. NA02950]
MTEPDGIRNDELPNGDMPDKGAERRRVMIWVASAVVAAIVVPAGVYALDSDDHGRSGPATSERSGTGKESGWIEESFFARVPKDGVFETHQGNLPLAVFPSGIAKFTEPELRKAFALGGKIRDKNGKVVGFSTEIEEVLPKTDFESGTMLTHTVWTLFFPGRGSLVLDQIENSTKVATKVFKPAFAGRKPWVGRLNATTTAGPRKDGRGVILGGTGEFAGIRGSGIEIADLRRFDPATGSLKGVFELRFRYRLPRR